MARSRSSAFSWSRVLSAAAVGSALVVTGVGSSSAKAPDDAASPIAVPAPPVGGAPGDSYKLTSSNRTIGGWGSDTIHAACGSGYSVRAGVGSAWTPGKYSVIAAIEFTDVSDSHDTIYHTDFGWERPVPGLARGREAYEGFWIKYRNAGTKETYRISWWCDAVPSWARSTQLSAPPPNPITPIGPGCTYCGIAGVIFYNELTGDVLDNAGGLKVDGNQLITYPATGGANQAFTLVGGVDNNYLPYAAIVPPDDRKISWGVSENPDNANVVLRRADASGRTPHGRWNYTPFGLAPHGFQVMFVNKDTSRCLTGGSGARPFDWDVHTKTCNTTDRAQWWTLTKR